ncbi:acyl carrier protein [Candidatus Saccharibacteria bacterium]|nr:acyl carrier protein [Candidatus Saccharibacteria bacterium]
MFEAVQKKIAEEFNIETGSITLKSHLRNDLEIDSMAAVNLSFELEGEFDIKISDDELAGLQTVSDIVTLLESKGAVVK